MWPATISKALANVIFIVFVQKNAQKRWILRIEQSARYVSNGYFEWRRRKWIQSCMTQVHDGIFGYRGYQVQMYVVGYFLTSLWPQRMMNTDVKSTDGSTQWRFYECEYTVINSNTWNWQVTPAFWSNIYIMLLIEFIAILLHKNVCADHRDFEVFTLYCVVYCRTRC